MKINKNNLLKYFISIAFITVFILIVYKIFKMDIGINDIKDYVSSFGKFGPIIYIIMFALVPLTLFPDSILAIAGGLLFGLYKGYIYTAIGALIGGSISFYISRKLGRGIVKKFTKDKLDNIEQMVNDKGFSIIFLLRLIPLFPFDVISYGAGLTSVGYKDFILATFLGTIPGILVFTNIGSKALNIGSESFYISIAFLIILVFTSMILKKRFIENNINESKEK